MSTSRRDNFNKSTRTLIGRQAGWHCSYSGCRRPTDGSNSEGDGEISIGVAAHICAAAPGGPRYDYEMSSEERKSARNGIWMCETHARLIDSKDPMFTVELLHEWKRSASALSWHSVVHFESEIKGAAPNPGEEELHELLRVAAANDLEVFRRSDAWAANVISRTFRVDGLDERVDTSGIAAALAKLDDLIVIAEPGMGKTTAVFQLAETVSENGYGSPFIVPLGDWLASDLSLLESIIRRATLREISEDDFRRVAENPGVILLLDGWNELDGEARRRATAELRRLKMELPNLSLLITTRKQALNVPIDGKRVSLPPLSETEQLEIARALRSDSGEHLLDEAWRTPGVRELVTIPLYLTALLALPEGGRFPTTKEEILRHFVVVHERDHRKIEALRKVTHGLHERYLADLGVTATRAANTTIVEVTARSAISDSSKIFAAEDQIAARPEPREVLEALVDHHVLIEVGEPQSYSFQHQQIQEWYASHFVEELMSRSIDDEQSRNVLKVEVLDQRAWEEPILFACERLARGNEAQQEACGKAILVALAVDPVLSAEMIYRSSDAVWQRVRPNVLDFIDHWHSPETVDRAVCFMVTSGCEDFQEHVWPLMTHEDDQVRLAVLRSGRRFRPSILGVHGADRIRALPTELRASILDEIASNSGIDGMDLAAAVAKADPAAEVKTSVAEALAFRRADRHVIDVLQDAGREIFDRLSDRSLFDHITEGSVAEGLAAARERSRAQGITPYDRISELLNGPEGDDREGKLATAIAEVEITDRNSGVAKLIHTAKERSPRAVAEGVLARVREGLELPIQAAELMGGADFALEDEALLSIALSENRRDYRADVAASVLGPQAVGRLIDRMFELKEQVQGSDGRHDEEAAKRYSAIKGRIEFTQSTHLLTAIGLRCEDASHYQIHEFTKLICRQGDKVHRGGRPFDAAAQTRIATYMEDWGEALLTSPDSTREQLASVASLAGHAPSAQLLQILERLLNEELRRWRAFGEQARAEDYRGGIATNEARTSWMTWYQHVFLSIHCPETTALMEGYLLDEDFGQHAALVLAGQWRAANEPREDMWWIRSRDFARIGEKREAREREPNASSVEADAIFSAVEQLLVQDATDDAKKRVVALGAIAAGLPHGERADLIDALFDMVDWRSRGPLLTNLILSGEMIDVEMVKQGIGELLEAGEQQPWILMQDHVLQDLLMAIPFTNSPSETIEIVQQLPQQHRTMVVLEEVVGALEYAPGDDAENVLFQIAEYERRLYASRIWRDTVCGRGTMSATTSLVDLIAQGVLDRAGRGGVWDISRRLASLMDQHSELRRHVYHTMESVPPPPGLSVLAQAVAENPDADGLMLLIQLEIEQGRTFTSQITIERVVTEQVPSDSWEGSYHMVPVPCVDLRRMLVAMTTDGGPNNIAARYLAEIDKMRDSYGVHLSEPRHPDIASGKAWPIIGSSSEACNVEQLDTFD